MDIKIPLTTKQWNALKEKIYDIKSTLKSELGLRNTFGDRIIIKDEVLVYEGDKLLFKSRGHIVNQGLINTINFMSCYSAGVTGPSQTWTTSPFTLGIMRVGTGTGATVGTMTDLVIASAVSPSSQAGATASPAVGTYRISWLATWNAGVLAAINVSELGLYLYMTTTLAAFGAGVGALTARAFFSRLSDSDGDFVTFLVNILVPLTIEWRLTFTFA